MINQPEGMSTYGDEYMQYGASGLLELEAVERTKLADNLYGLNYIINYVNEGNVKKIANAYFD